MSSANFSFSPSFAHTGPHRERSPKPHFLPPFLHGTKGFLSVLADFKSLSGLLAARFSTHSSVPLSSFAWKAAVHASPLIGQREFAPGPTVHGRSLNPPSPPPPPSPLDQKTLVPFERADPHLFSPIQEGSSLGNWPQFAVSGMSFLRLKVLLYEKAPQS